MTPYKEDSEEDSPISYQLSAEKEPRLRNSRNKPSLAHKSGVNNSLRNNFLRNSYRINQTSAACTKKKRNLNTSTSSEVLQASPYKNIPSRRNFNSTLKSSLLSFEADEEIPEEREFVIPEERVFEEEEEPVPMKLPKQYPHKLNHSLSSLVEPKLNRVPKTKSIK
uniref:Uncharacterized protein n=1 Tax=Euplotes crassus TaxID=5936 RepID=A0A7S3KWR9_EUPCR|mmetsp:Transcript_9661/g.9466  ORF Transcript_9661/g.9466 Transcript_9661/m.9466 type:complete len:166 (+) Transcript_9661:206-703(+)